MAANAKFIIGNGGLPAICVESDVSIAEIYLHGAHVTKFQKKDEPPLLWLSRESRFDSNTPIRGGIPLVFPWFGGRQARTLKHGFARIKAWHLLEIAHVAGGEITLRFQLPPQAEDSDFADLEALYSVTVGKSLGLEFEVKNNSKTRTVSFEECLHTYFAVGDIGALSLHGLKGCKYLDTVGGVTERLESGDAIKVSSEVDRIYYDTPATVEIRDEKFQRVIRVEKNGSLSTVVWNPWIDKAKAMADFGDAEYQGMICVESGNIRSNSINLAPGMTSKLSVRISSAPI